MVCLWANIKIFLVVLMIVRSGSTVSLTALGAEDLDDDWVQDLKDLEEIDDKNGYNDDSPSYDSQDENQNGAMDSIYKSATNSTDKLNSTNYFEVDILSGVQENEEDSSDYGGLGGSARKRVVRSRELLWRNARVSVMKANDFDRQTSARIDQVMIGIMEKTCIKFVPALSNTRGFVNIKKGPRCSSYVGRQGGEQELTIASECSDYGAITHLILHALGLWHEQSRPDRDNHIEILWENIYPGEEYRFNKQSLSSADHLGLPYDYESIMHYGTHIFAINESLPTMRSIHPSRPINPGQRMSVLDIQKLNMLYGCTNDRIAGRGKWSSFGPCNSNCLKTRQRLCPQCTDAVNGIQTETDVCSQKECNAPVAGHWGRWSYYTCDVSCGFGNTRTRSRQCNDPRPKNDGDDCVGKSSETQSERCFRGHCLLNFYDCQFESFQTCNWKNMVNSEYKYSWQPRSGGTPTAGTGPYSDSTVGTPEGVYMYFETSSPTEKDDKVAFRSPVIQITDDVCLTMKYHMYGATMGTLNVIVFDGTSLVVWSVSGNQGKAWKEARIDISRTTPYYVVIEGNSGGPMTSDMAIDDIKLRRGCCSLNPAKTLLPPTEPPSTASEPTSLTAEPGFSTKEPPLTSTERSTTSTTETSTAATTEALSTSTEVPTITNRPSSTVTKFPTTTSQPVTTTSQSVTATIQPFTTTTEAPTTTIQPLAIKTDAPSAASQLFTYSTETPSFTTKPSVTTSEAATTTSISTSSIITNSPISATVVPSSTTEPSTTATNAPASASQGSTPITHYPASTFLPSTITSEQPLSSTEHPRPSNKSSIVDFCNFDEDKCGWYSRHFYRAQGGIVGGDHTSGKGYYMISNGWAKLEKEFNVTSNKFSLQFWFYQNSTSLRGLGWLAVFVKARRLRKIGYVGRSSINGWKMFSKEFKTYSKKFKIILVSTFRFRIAVDDIRISHEELPVIPITPSQNFTCNFNKDDCGFRRIRAYPVSFSCKRRSGRLSFEYSNTRYSRPRSKVAIVVSPTFNTSSGSCVRFSYAFMSSAPEPSRITLRLFLRQHYSIVLWTASKSSRGRSKPKSSRGPARPKSSRGRPKSKWSHGRFKPKSWRGRPWHKSWRGRPWHKSWRGRHWYKSSHGRLWYKSSHGHHRHRPHHGRRIRRSDSWRNAEIPVNKAGIFEIGFSGVLRNVPRYARASIAVDNFSLVSGPCQVTPSPRPAACRDKSRICRLHPIVCRVSFYAKLCPKFCGRCAV